MRSGRASVALPGGSWPNRVDTSAVEWRRDRIPRWLAGVSTPSSNPRTGVMPVCGVFSSMPFSARCHVSPERPPHPATPCSPWFFTPSPSRARPEAQAARQARYFPRLRTAVCLLRNAPWARTRNARPRFSALEGRKPRPGKSRCRVPALQSTEGVALTHGILCPLSLGRREFHAVRECGTPHAQAGSATRGEPCLCSGRVTGTPESRRSSRISDSRVSMTFFRSVPHA